MSLKIGVSTLCLFKQPFNHIFKEIDRRGEIRTWEIVDEGFHKLNSRRIKKLKEFDVEYTVHAPFSDLNTASLTTEFRNLAFKVLKKSLYHAYKLSSAIWVLHAGMHTPLGYFYSSKEWKVNVKVVKQLAEEAEKHGIIVAVENLAGRGILKTEEDVLKFLNEVYSKNVFVCLDIGHLNIVKGRNLLNSLRKLRGKLVTLHLHDSDGVVDRHWKVGSGGINWENILKFLVKTKFNGYGIVENYTINDSIESLEKIHLILRMRRRS